MAEVLKFYDVPNNALWFRNFAGKAGRFNNEGDRNFCLVLNDNDAKEMAEEGYNVKWYQSKRNPDEPPTPYLKIKVGFRNRYGEPSKIQPKIVQLTNGGRSKTRIYEENAEELDWAEIDKVDISIRPVEYEPGKISAYLKTMYVTLSQDDFEDRYPDMDGDYEDD